MNAQKQQGMVLLVSLILLLMLTLIAIAASSQSTLQLRISSNSEQRTAAFQAAEGGLSKWAAAYFNRENNLPLEGDFGSNQHYAVDESNSRYNVPCPGVSLGLMSCFDLRVTGTSSCDANGDNCAATRIHLQGGQRREPLSSN